MFVKEKGFISPANSEQSVHIVVNEGLGAYLPLAGMVDVAKEVVRLKKQEGKLSGEVEGLKKRLSSPSVSDFL